MNMSLEVTASSQILETTASYLTTWTAPDDLSAAIDMWRKIRYVSLVFIKPIVSVFGIFSNLIAILALFKRAKKKSAFNYILGMAVVDLIYLFQQPIISIIHAFPNFTYNYIVVCNLFLLSVYLPSQCSLGF